MSKGTTNENVTTKNSSTNNNTAAPIINLRSIPDSAIFDKDVEDWNSEDEAEMISRLRRTVERLRRSRESFTKED